MLVNQVTHDIVCQVMKDILCHYIPKKVLVTVTCYVLCKDICDVKVSEILKRSLVQHFAVTVSSLYILIGMLVASNLGGNMSLSYSS
jgi:hypothetical protein